MWHNFPQSVPIWIVHIRSLSSSSFSRWIFFLVVFLLISKATINTIGYGMVYCMNVARSLHLSLILSHKYIFSCTCTHIHISLLCNTSVCNCVDTEIKLNACTYTKRSTYTSNLLRRRRSVSYSFVSFCSVMRLGLSSLFYSTRYVCASTLRDLSFLVMWYV